MKTAKEILSELTVIPEYRMNDDKGEYVTKSGALEAMERYAEQFKISSSPVLSDSSPDFELKFCEVCFQMTNHLDGKCQKCKPNLR